MALQDLTIFVTGAAGPQMTVIPSTAFGQGLLNLADATALNALTNDFSGRNVIYVSKGAAATDTRTGLSKYDATRPFATPLAAASAATAGDAILTGPGTFALGATPLVIPTGVTLSGLGWNTVLTGTAESAQVVPSAGSVIENLKISADICLGASQTSDCWSGDAWARNLWIVASGDAAYLVSLSTVSSRLNVLNCRIDSTYDGVVISADGASVIVRDTDVSCNGTGQTHEARGLRAVFGTIDFARGNVTAIQGQNGDDGGSPGTTPDFYGTVGLSLNNAGGTLRVSDARVSVTPRTANNGIPALVGEDDTLILSNVQLINNGTNPANCIESFTGNPASVLIYSDVVANSSVASNINEIIGSIIVNSSVQ